MIISFIFLFTIYSNTVYAITNEIVNCDEIIEDTQEETDEITENKVQEVEIDVTDTEEKLNQEEVVQEENEEKTKEEQPIITNITETTVMMANYRGALCIDTPSNNQTITRPDMNQITIAGWAVSDDTNASVRILLDGNVVINNATRNQRADVDRIVSPEYGGANLTPKAGYSGTIDISNQNAGMHRIRVEEISRYGNVVAVQERMVNVQNKNYRGALCIDTPSNNQIITRPDVNQITIAGWAVSDDTNASVRILLDGNVVINNATRNQRADVDRIVSPEYGGANLTPKAGYSGTIDISNQNAGMHRIRVEEISRYGNVVAVQETMFNMTNRKYQGSICLDSPRNGETFIKPNANRITIEGWAVSNDTGASVRVLVDGNISANNLTRKQRVDVDQLVSPQYGGPNITPRAGFLTVLDIGNCVKGVHKIRVEEISRYGEVISGFEVGIHVTNQTYAGEMCIDTPTFQQTYQQGANMAVDGWAVAQDESARIEIYVDHVFKAVAERYYRADIVSYSNKYGGKTVNAGFGKLISTAGMSAGLHTLTVYEKSRYGDVIGGLETQFVVNVVMPPSNPPPSQTNQNNGNNHHTSNVPTSGTKGIDVSQYQGNINWSSVANSGMKYAMIRIGYRGYGTGGLAEDPKFRANFAGAVGHGMKTGVYFYSTAVNTAEAKRDAEYVVSLLRKYGYQNQVSMPIALDLELIAGVNTRDKNVSRSMRTSIANTFGDTIASYGYTPMIYACKSFLNDNMNASQIRYDVWVAQYNSKCTYNGRYTMWQYTSTGKVSGISGNVDCNVCYKNY